MKFLLILISFALAIRKSNECLALGGCWPYCYNYQYSYQNPYQCGYNRYCNNKARASKTIQNLEFSKEESENSQSPEFDIRKRLHILQKEGSKWPESPDELFVQCCQTWNLPDICLTKCNFPNYTTESLRSMFFRMDACPIEAASIIHYCASQNRDHRHCCSNQGIAGTSAGDKCLIFCDQMPTNETHLDIAYLPCLEKFSDMKRCFLEDALREVDYLDLAAVEMEQRQTKNVMTSTNYPELGGVKAVDSFIITRPPIVFINNPLRKMPVIKDEYSDN
ncbi:DB module domain-containing protein [Ditylenchus destructor]|uniref:DB module domain-containing protein n=1 Tax=Ditylenchus destructor TaxID=166010 RepID=A0AAD4NAB4_9BILA|nr:DB module domain-containing protein [Ditylenchus destructor]